MPKGTRSEKVGDVLLSFLANQLQRLGDPSFEDVTLTGIDVSPDLKNAVVYWTVTPKSLIEGAGGSAAVSAPGAVDPVQIDQVGKALTRIIQLLKRRIGDELELRYIPTLRFSYDKSFEEGSRIDFLLKKAGF